MSSSNPGIKRILFCDKNTLATTPADPIALGFRSEGSMAITPFGTVEVQGGGQLPNKRNFHFEFESFQATMHMLDKMRQWVNLECDIEMVTAKQPGTTPASNVFKFVSNNRLGLGFKYTLSNEKRSLNVVAESALTEDAAAALIFAAKSAPATTVTAITNAEGNNLDFYKPPRVEILTWGGSSLIADPRDIVSYNLTIETEATKDLYNTDIVNQLNVNLEIVTRAASIDNIKDAITANRAAALVLTQYNNTDGTLYDKFDFAEGAMLRVDETTIGDAERTHKITCTRKVSIYDFAFEFGDGKGGATEDTKGETGGTCKIGY